MLHSGCRLFCSLLKEKIRTHRLLDGGSDYSCLVGVFLTDWKYHFVFVNIKIKNVIIPDGIIERNAG